MPAAPPVTMTTFPLILEPPPQPELDLPSRQRRPSLAEARVRPERQGRVGQRRPRKELGAVDRIDVVVHGVGDIERFCDDVQALAAEEVKAFGEAQAQLAERRTVLAVVL